MEGRMDSIPEDARRRVKELLDEAYKDRYAEVEVRFGKFVTQPRLHFETDIGKRAMDKIDATLGEYRKWTNIERIDTVDTFLRFPSGNRLRQTENKNLVNKIPRDRVDVVLAHFPFDLRVSYASEIPVEAFEEPGRPTFEMVRRKERKRFVDRGLFHYDLTTIQPVSDKPQEPRYELEIEMADLCRYIRSRGTEAATESLFLKALDIERLFM